MGDPKERNDSSDSESEFETEVILQPPVPERKSRHKRRGRKDGTKEDPVKVSNPTEEYDVNGNPKDIVEVRKSRSKTKKVVPIQPIKLKQWEKVEPASTTVDAGNKYSRG